MSKQQALNELKKRKEVTQALGGPKAIERHRKRGHLTARERLDKLLDEGSWREIGELEQFVGPDGKEYHVNKIHGYGKIDGRIVIVQTDDSTILAGTGGRGVSGLMRKKGLHDDLLPERNFPYIRLGESGGVHLQSVMGSTGVLAVTYPATRLLYPRRVPRITAIMGLCFGDPTWQASISDFVVQVKGTCMAVSGPRVLEVALSEKITPEELGGWKLHAEVTGLVDAFAEDDEHCLKIIREYLSYLPSHGDEEPPCVPSADPPDRKTEKLMNIIPEVSTRAYDMSRVVKDMVDDGKMFILKPFFGKSLITCLARMNGRVVGILANQVLYNVGAAGAQECEKATSFIVLCDSFNIPIINLADTPGLLVGKDAERNKIPTKIMNWMEALALATVPKITVIIRKAYGMAISNMGGPNCGADFIAALTTAEISFMSPEAAANVVWAEKIAAAEDPEEERKRLIEEMQYGSAPWQAAADGWLDEVLDPRDLRTWVIERLEIMHARKNGFMSQKKLRDWPTGY
jgi:acetyl-CoA carboxylase carboxyltransferase component